MKKTILAVAVTLAATSVNAAEIYNKDGVKLDLGGAAEVQYKKARLVKEEAGKEIKPESNFRLDDGDLFATTTVTVNDDLKGIGKAAFKFESKNVENDELYVGLQHNQFGTFTAGRQSTTFDGAGISEGIEFGLKFFKDEVTTLAVGSGDSVAKYKGTFGNAWVGASYAEFEKGVKDSEKFAYDLAGGYKFGDIETALYLQHVKADAVKAGTIAFNKAKGTTIHGQVKATFDAITIAASYANTKITADSITVGSITAKNPDVATLNVAKLSGSYKLTEKTTLAGGYDYADAKDSLKVHNVYANVSHKLHNNVKVYTEIGHADVKPTGADKLKTEFGYVAGLEVKF